MHIPSANRKKKIKLNKIKIIVSFTCHYFNIYKTKTSREQL